MPHKSHLVSVRLTDEDAAFLAVVQIPGASTPSEKIRSILMDAKRKNKGTTDYSSCLSLVHDMMLPARKRIKQEEHNSDVQSEFVAKLYEWMEEVTALLVIGPEQHNDRGEELRHFESRLADRAFALSETILRLGTTSSCRCYDTHLVRDRIAPSLELCDVIKAKTAMDERHGERNGE